MQFILASGVVSKARAATRRWNRENPEQFVPWEWVEEAVIARIRDIIITATRGVEETEHYERYREFANRLPEELRHKVIPTTEDLDGFNTV
jgi:hypothetical protein